MTAAGQEPSHQLRQQDERSSRLWQPSATAGDETRRHRSDTLRDTLTQKNLGREDDGAHQVDRCGAGLAWALLESHDG